MRPSVCMSMLQVFHVQQFRFESDEYGIILAVFPKLLSMMNKHSKSPKQWFPERSRGSPLFVQFEKAGGFRKFGLNPETFQDFLSALRTLDLEILDIGNFLGMCRFVPWSEELQCRSHLFRFDNFEGEQPWSTFQMPVTKLESLTSSDYVNTV